MGTQNGKQTKKDAKRVAPAGALVVLPEKGITGTPNYSGKPDVEENPQLDYEKAFGTAGQITWGEYDRIIRTDPDAAAGLDLLCAQIRDARLDVEPAKLPDEKAAQVHADFLKWNLAESSMVSSKAAIRGQLKTGQRA